MAAREYLRRFATCLLPLGLPLVLRAESSRSGWFSASVIPILVIELLLVSAFLADFRTAADANGRLCRPRRPLRSVVLLFVLIGLVCWRAFAPSHLGGAPETATETDILRQIRIMPRVQKECRTQSGRFGQSEELRSVGRAAGMPEEVLEGRYKNFTIAVYAHGDYYFLRATQLRPSQNLSLYTDQTEVIRISRTPEPAGDTSQAIASDADARGER